MKGFILPALVATVFAAAGPVCTSAEADGGHCEVTAVRTYDLDGGTPNYAWQSEDGYFDITMVPVSEVKTDGCERTETVYDGFPEDIRITRNSNILSFSNTEELDLDNLPQYKEPQTLKTCQIYWTGYHYTLSFEDQSLTREETRYYPTGCSCDITIRKGSRDCNDEKWDND